MFDGPRTGIVHRSTDLNIHSATELAIRQMPRSSPPHPKLCPPRTTVHEHLGRTRPSLEPFDVPVEQARTPEHPRTRPACCHLLAQGRAAVGQTTAIASKMPLRATPPALLGSARLHAIGIVHYARHGPNSCSMSASNHRMFGTAVVAVVERRIVRHVDVHTLDPSLRCQSASGSPCEVSCVRPGACSKIKSPERISGRPSIIPPIRWYTEERAAVKPRSASSRLVHKEMLMTSRSLIRTLYSA
jgi:hypothetical protein